MHNTKETLVELSEQLRYCAVDDDCINCKRWDFDCGSRHCLDDLMLKASELLKSIANGITVKEWISVKDRLPDRNDVIIAFYPTMRGTSGEMQIHKAWAMSDTCTHWRYLPQPPKGD